ncbi:MAG: hypothetical protein WCE62_17140 [Polyangiales bacterium]
MLGPSPSAHSGRWIVNTGDFVVDAKPSFPSEWPAHMQVLLERGFAYQFGFTGAFSLYTPGRNWPHIINHEHESFSL